MRLLEMLEPTTTVRDILAAPLDKLPEDSERVHILDGEFVVEVLSVDLGDYLGEGTRGEVEFGRAWYMVEIGGDEYGVPLTRAGAQTFDTWQLQARVLRHHKQELEIAEIEARGDYRMRPIDMVDLARDVCWMGRKA